MGVRTWIRYWLGQESDFESIELLIASSDGDLLLPSSDRLDDPDGGCSGQRDVWSDGEGQGDGGHWVLCSHGGLHGLLQHLACSRDHDVPCSQR